MRQQDKSAGFTLLELLVVVIVVGILASLALPKFIKTIEKARIAEAKAVMGEVRSSETRYMAEHSGVTTVLTELDIDSPNLADPRYFNYTISTTDPALPGCTAAGTDYWIVAQRVSSVNRPAPPPGIDPDYQVVLSDTGNFCDELN